MFGSFIKPPARLEPESKWRLAIDDDRISVRDEAGALKSIAKAELSGVAIETNDTGPWGADVWWLLFGSGGQLICAFPQGATGEQAAVDYFLQLPSFDHDRMTEAMRSTSNAVFPVWRRPD